jgi:hypothetical protein
MIPPERGEELKEEVFDFCRSMGWKPEDIEEEAERGEYAPGFADLETG